MNRVDGKVALISGGARGIGAAAAKKLALAGASVVITDLLEEAGEATAAEIRGLGGNALFLRHDVTSESEWQSVIKTTVDRFGGLDVLVNNAGLLIATPTESMSLAQFHQLTAVNLDGVFLGTKVAVAAMNDPARRTICMGSIINMSSVAGIKGSALSAAYCMTKGGVRLFTKATALDFARYRIRVNSVHPGVIDTRMGDQCEDLLIQAGLAHGENEARDALAGMHPIGRIGLPSDIADAVLFLASEDSKFMTGSEMVVDGGQTAG